MNHDDTKEHDVVLMTAALLMNQRVPWPPLGVAMLASAVLHAHAKLGHGTLAVRLILHAGVIKYTKLAGGSYD